MITYQPVVGVLNNIEYSHWNSLRSSISWIMNWDDKK